MATAHTYAIPGTNQTIIRGKMDKMVGYGFVNFSTATLRSSGEHHTFIVPLEYIDDERLLGFGTQVGVWETLALDHIVGDWCPRYEKLWKDIPSNIYVFPDQKFARYGMSHTPHPTQPGTYLWYIVIHQDVIYNDFTDFAYNTFLINESQLKPQYLERMGSDKKRWSLVSWDRPANDQDPRVMGYQVSTHPGENRAFELDALRQPTLWERIRSLFISTP